MKLSKLHIQILEECLNEINDEETRITIRLSELADEGQRIRRILAAGDDGAAASDRLCDNPL